MEEKIYVVTLYNHEDLEQFYDEMAANGFRVSMKRPLSRNTHYWMLEEQAEELKKDSRIWDIRKLDEFKIKPQAIINNNSYTKTGTFWKDDTVGAPTVSATDLQWGHLHIAGNQTQRRKGSWGSGDQETVNDSVTIFNDGKHVDVIIVDDPISYDCEEWKSPSTNQNRFVQYQWFTQLNSIVNSIDDDSQTEPTGTIIYPQNAVNPYSHGVHVAGTACGKYYGWARESNIYNLAVTAAWSSGQIVGALQIYDYLRAFHRTKPINPITGRKNPTITNHSYNGIFEIPSANLSLSDITSITYRGQTYTSSSPGPSGWSKSGLITDFGVRFDVPTYPSWSASVLADVQDAIREGIILIGAAGNDNLLISKPGQADWNNTVSITGLGSIYYNRGAWPCTPDSGTIVVGSLSKYSNFRRSTYTNFGPGINVFAPGDNIISSYTNTGLLDTKYGGSNYYYPNNGTSMASPQVCGVVACICGSKPRFNQGDAHRYISETSVINDMTFNSSDGSFNDPSCQKGSPNRYLALQNPRKPSGLIQETFGERKSTGQTFPRTRMYYTTA